MQARPASINAYVSGSGMGAAATAAELLATVALGKRDGTRAEGIELIAAGEAEVGLVADSACAGDNVVDGRRCRSCETSQGEGLGRADDRGRVEQCRPGAPVVAAEDGVLVAVVLRAEVIDVREPADRVDRAGEGGENPVVARIQAGQRAAGVDPEPVARQLRRRRRERRTDVAGEEVAERRVVGHAGGEVGEIQVLGVGRRQCGLREAGHPQRKPKRFRLTALPLRSGCSTARLIPGALREC